MLLIRANIAQQIVRKSGQVTNALRAGGNIANVIAINLDILGVPNESLAHTATGQLAKGAHMLDNKRDRLANQIENARNAIQIKIKCKKKNRKRKR